MKFFKSYKLFENELNNAQVNDKMNSIDTELSEETPDLNKVLRKINKVIIKSNPNSINDHEIKSHINDIYTKFKEKLEKASDKDEIMKDHRYTTFKNFAEAVEKNQTENAQKIAAEGKKMQEEEEKKKQESEANKNTGDKEKEKTDVKEVDSDKFKNLFKNAKISANSAPQLSKTLVKTELPEVKALQQFLVDKGYLQLSEATASDGYFGDKTAQAVMAYQKDKGLTQDGIVGTNTWKAILSDVKIEPAADFKATQMNAKAPTATDVKKPEDKKLVDAVKADLTKAGITAENAKALTLDKIVEILAAERMTAFGVDSDEELIFNTLLGQVSSGVINGNTIVQLDQKYKDFNDSYKDERKNGLFADLIEVFDTNAGEINTKLQNQLQFLQKQDPNFIQTKQSIFTNAAVSINNSPAIKYVLLPALTGGLLGGDISKVLVEDTAKCATLFIAFVALKNTTVNEELKKLKINVDVINKIIATAAAVGPKKEEEKTANA